MRANRSIPLAFCLAGLLLITLAVREGAARRQEARNASQAASELRALRAQQAEVASRLEQWRREEAALTETSTPSPGTEEAPPAPKEPASGPEFLKNLFKDQFFSQMAEEDVRGKHDPFFAQIGADEATRAAVTAALLRHEQESLRMAWDLLARAATLSYADFVQAAETEIRMKEALRATLGRLLNADDFAAYLDYEREYEPRKQIEELSAFFKRHGMPLEGEQTSAALRILVDLGGQEPHPQEDFDLAQGNPATTIALESARWKTLEARLHPHLEAPRRQLLDRYVARKIQEAEKEAQEVLLLLRLIKTFTQ